MSTVSTYFPLLSSRSVYFDVIQHRTRVVAHCAKLFLSVSKRLPFLYTCQKSHGSFLERYERLVTRVGPRKGASSPNPACLLWQGLPTTQKALLLLFLWEEGEDGRESRICIRYLAFQAELSQLVEIIQLKFCQDTREHWGPRLPREQADRSLSSRLKQPRLCFSSDLEGN